MRGIILLVFICLIFLSSCEERKVVSIIIEGNSSDYDSLYIVDIYSGQTLLKMPLEPIGKEYKFQIQETSLGEIAIKGLESTYLTVLRPEAKKIVVIDSNTIRVEQSIADSLANYLWKSTNLMFSQHDKVIFAEDDPWKVRGLFDSLVQVREDQLMHFESQLTEEELGLLTFQNKARAYSFLMFYGRIIKEISPEDGFFGFVKDIENENIYTKSLPNTLLYKYEIELLSERDSIENLGIFLDYIEKNTKTEDLQHFLKAVYLKEVIENPSYWRPHEKLFTSTTIKEALLQESKNPYAFLIDRASSSFFSSQSGVKGFDFKANRFDGSEIKLSDFKGKIVVIDTWATWCGPCIQHRPNMLEIAKKYENNPRVAILMISIDQSKEKWLNYVQKTNPDQFGMELHIPDGMNTEFGDMYLIKSIPKYFLIDQNGIILNSDLLEPSIGMEQLIENELKKFPG
ncbi:TlpA family protein disulfide reductase [Shivajiella indica]|uniref:TlpA family protein disulfide reductase n=1 Tax=Shivajiella indica TaxID=872115 RepID=A0ABW5B637_9BACT